MSDALRRSRVSLVSLAALGVVAAACSSPSSSSSTGTDAPGAVTTTSVAASAPTTAAPNAHDQTTANAVVLRTSDLPGLWTVGPIDPNSTAGDAQLSRCLGVPDSDPDETAYTGSPVFSQTSNGSSIQITSQTNVYTDASVVQGDLRGYRSPHATTCVSTLLKNALPGVSRVHLSVSALPAAAGTLDGFRLTGTLEIEQGQKAVAATIDEVAMTKDRTEVTLDILTMNASQPTGLMDTATAALAPRLEAVA